MSREPQPRDRRYRTSVGALVVEQSPTALVSPTSALPATRPARCRCARLHRGVALRRRAAEHSRQQRGAEDGDGVRRRRAGGPRCPHPSGEARTAHVSGTTRRAVELPTEKGNADQVPAGCSASAGR
jgi:hypothetical protein